MAPRVRTHGSDYAPMVAFAALLGVSAWVLAHSVLVPAIRMRPGGLPAFSFARADQCETKIAEKLGTTFYRVCPARSDEPAFWISAPLRCSEGGHDSVSCPSATSVVAPQALPARAGSHSSARAASAMMVDSFVAHRLCGLRFAGHVATLNERMYARSVLGIATLAAVADDAEGGTVLAEFPEWVSDGACDNPSLPSQNCRYASFPPVSVNVDADWERLRTCDARPLSAVPAAADRTESRCRLQESEEAGEPRECTIAGVGPAATWLQLSCNDQPVSTRPLQEPAPRAAVRCVVNEAALVGMMQ
jgi:hypothetical protein